MNSSVKKKEFLPHIHYFRGFAILNILILHIWRLPYKDGDYHYYYHIGINLFKEVLFHNSTIYFLFISGFLFRYLSDRIKFYKFYSKKIKYLIAPYIFWSLFSILTHQVDYVDVSSIKKILIFGTAQLQYWYIPFFVIILLINPILLSLKTNHLKILTLIALFLPLLGTRMGTSISLNQYIFLYPSYLLGFYISTDFKTIDSYIKKYNTSFILISSVSTFLLFFVYRNQVHYGINFFEALSYIQKISATFWILNVFQNIKSKTVSSFLNKFSNYSFPLFFTHYFFIQYLEKYFFFYIGETHKTLTVPYSILFTVIIITFHLYLNIGIKKIFNSYSKYIIGY